MMKQKMKEKNHDSTCHVKNIVLGATAGCLIGASAMVLLNPKLANQIRRKINGTFEDISERAEDVVHDFVEKGEKAFKKVSDYAENAKERASDWFDETTGNSSAHLLAGAIGGGILGATTILLLTSTATQEVGRKARENFKSVDWLMTAKEVIEAISSHLNSCSEEECIASSEEAQSSRSNFQDAVELATMGLRFWQNIKKGR